MSEQNINKEEALKKDQDSEKEKNEKEDNMTKINDSDKDNNNEKKEEDINNDNKKEKIKNIKEEDKKSLNKITKNKKKLSNSDSLISKEDDNSLGDDSNSENKDDEMDEGEDEENDDEDDIDDEDDDDDDEDDEDKTDSSFSEDKKKKDPYHTYINSKVSNCIYFDTLEKGDYLFNIEQNKYFKIVNINSKGNKGDKYNINLELIDNLKTKTKKDKILMKQISDNIIYKALNYNNKKGKIKDKNVDNKNEEEKIDINSIKIIINNNNNNDDDDNNE